MKIKAYIEGVVDEMLTKVTWPTWADLQNSAFIVLISSVIVALLVWLMDFIFGIQGNVQNPDVLWRGILGFIYRTFIA